MVVKTFETSTCTRHPSSISTSWLEGPSLPLLPKGFIVSVHCHELTVVVPPSLMTLFTFQNYRPTSPALPPQDWVSLGTFTSIWYHKDLFPMYSWLALMMNDILGFSSAYLFVFRLVEGVTFQLGKGSRVGTRSRVWFRRSWLSPV